MTYLDYNATAPARPEVIEAVRAALQAGGNPSSVHSSGRAAHARLETARGRLATALATDAGGVVFTSGATEANNLALAGRCGRVLVSAVEHPSVLEAAPDAPQIPVDPHGVVRLDALENLLARHRPELVAVIAANNETGVLQPIPEIAALVHGSGAYLHVDAVQQFGRLPFAMPAVGADLCSLSAHKLGGPPGVGALVLRGEPPLSAQIRGGGQERWLRAGTENLPGISGFAAALGLETDWDMVRRLRDRLETEVRRLDADAVIVGASAPRLPGTSCIVTPGLPAETQVIAFDLQGVAVSSGAACSSGKVAASHVLRAMGMPSAKARCAVRVSLGWASQAGDIDRFLEVYAGLLRRRHGRLAVA